MTDRPARTAGRRPRTEVRGRRPAVVEPRVPERVGATGYRLAVAVGWLGLVVAIVPWWLDTPAGALRDTPAALTAAGRISGLVAGYLLLVQVLLMSRLALLERWVGAERLTRWHRDVGATLVVAVLAHAALILVGYAGLDGLSVVDEASVLLREYEDMIGAFAAAGILVFLGVTGIRALRTALPYEFWYFLHLSSYLVLILGFGHQFANGEQLFQPGFARGYWTALYVAVLAAVLWGRVVAPLRLNLRHRLRVADVVAESRDTVSVYVTGDDLHRLTVHGGQFFRWRFLARGRWWQAHPFSLSAPANGRWLRLTAKIVGRHTADLRDLRPGTRVWVAGPAGTFTAARRTRERALLIAAGSGISPVRALAEELPPGSSLIYRARTPGDVLLRHELDWLAQARGMDVWYVIGSRSDPGPSHALSPAGLRQLVPDVTRRDVYVCGPAGFAADAVTVLREIGVPRRQIHLATFEL